MKAVIFDLDGTLLNTLDDLSNAANHMLRELNYPTHDCESYKYRVGNGIPKLISRSLPPYAQEPDILAAALSKFNDCYSAHKAECTASYEGIDALLATLKSKDIIMAVATNKEQTFARQLIDRYFPHTFSYVAGMHEGMAPKPDPAIVLNIMDKLCLKPADTVYLGDSGVDMLTACNAGLYAVGVLWGFRQAEELSANGASLLIHKPKELLRLL